MTEQDKRIEREKKFIVKVLKRCIAKEIKKKGKDGLELE